jgi:uroporphyrinogen decarboxylase
MPLSKIERVRAALAGDAPERPPYGFWTHLPGIDLDPPRLAAATAAFAARYELDFIKAMPNGLYCVEDWGCVCDYSEVSKGGVARVVKPAVTAPVDWARIARVDVTRGAFGRELDHLARLVTLAGPDTPVLATVFSPLTVAAKLSGGASRAHLATHPAALRGALQAITEVSCAFARAAVERGCAGVFLAIQEATRQAMDEATYQAFGEPGDRRVLEAAVAAGGWFNAVHLHGEDVLFDLVARYERAALNWHIGETPPAIRDYRAAGGAKPVLGGLQRGHLTRRDLAAVRADIARAMDETGGRGILLAPACVIRHPVDDATLTAAAAAIRALAR